MKSIKYFIPLLLMGAAVSSCDDFLDVKPVGKMIPTEVTQFENLLNNSRTIQFTFMDNNHISPVALQGDNLCITKVQADFYYTAQSYILEALAAHIYYDRVVQPEVTPYYWSSGFYSQIAIFNNVIDGIEGLGVDDDYSRGVIAQARAARAWLYMYSAVCYGPMYDPNGQNDTPVLPLRTSGDPTVGNGSLATTQQIFDQVKSDLDYACENAPEVTSTPGRANRAAAYALRAEYNMLTRNWNAMLADARTAWDKSIANKGSADNLFYDLKDFYYEGTAPDVGELDDPRDYMNFRGPDSDYGTAKNRENLLFREAAWGPMRTKFYLSDDFISIFDQEHDRRWNLYALVKAAQYTLGGQAIADTPHRVWNKDDYTSTSHCITYPSLLLTKAEAEARTGNTSAALADLNTLRKYRYSYEDTDLPNGASLTQDQLLEEILKERRREQQPTAFNRTVDLKRYVFDAGKPWCKETITHTIGDKKFSAPVSSFKLEFDNPTLRFNPQWGIEPSDAPYQPYSKI